MLRLRPGHQDFAAVLVGAVPRGTERREAGYAQRLLWALATIGAEFRLWPSRSTRSRGMAAGLREERILAIPAPWNRPTHRIELLGAQGVHIPRASPPFAPGSETSASAVRRRRQPESTGYDFVPGPNRQGRSALAAQEDSSRGPPHRPMPCEASPTRPSLGLASSRADFASRAGRAFSPNQRERLTCGLMSVILQSLDRQDRPGQPRAGCTRSGSIRFRPRPGVRSSSCAPGATPGGCQDRLQAQGGRSGRLAESRACGSAGIDGNPESRRSETMPSSRDRDVCAGLVESRSGAGKACWLTRPADTADLDQGALDAERDRGHGHSGRYFLSVSSV